MKMISGEEKRFIMSKPGSTLVVLMLCVLGAPALLGQGTAGTIVGTVLDPSGATIANASVSVKNQGTNETRIATTGAGGDYSVPLLPPGNYQVTVQASSFAKAVTGVVSLSVNQTVRVDVGLQLGESAQAVEVTGEAPLIQTDSSSLGGVIDQTNVSTLPLNQRNFVSFTYLIPGAQFAAEGSIDSTQGLALSVNGARETANNFLIDGIDDNDLVINQYAAIPSLDAVQEFKVQSGNYTAEYGRSGGAQVNVALKSGTNQFHGTAFEFLRNRHMDSKNYFDRPDCTAALSPGSCGPIPNLDRSQFGGSLGGPIVHNKTFFFIDFEYLDQREASTREATVPSQAQVASALAAVPNPNAAGLNIFKLYPAANVGSNLATSNTFVSAPISTLTTPFGVAKVDQQLGANDMLAGHFVISWGTAGNAFDPLASYTNLPGFGTTVLTDGQNGGITWTHIFNSRTINELRTGYNGERGFFIQTNRNDENKALGFPDVLTSSLDLGYPNVSLSDFSSIGQPTNTPQDHPTYTLDLADNLAWNPAFNGGRHQFHFGFEYRYYWYSLLFDTDARGIWNFQGQITNSCDPQTGNVLVELLCGTPDNVTTVLQGVTMDIRAPSYDAYVQDDIHLTSKLTLNAGLRWELNIPPYETQNHFSTPDLSSNSVTCTPKPNCQWLEAGTDGVPRGLYSATYHDFAPRIGLAWRPFNSDRFVARAAFGMFYDIVPLNANLEARLNPPFRNTLTITNTTGTATIQSIVNQPPGAIGSTGSFMDRHFHDAYMEDWNLDTQYQLQKDLMIDLNYVGTRGVGLPGNTNINQPNVGGPSPYPQFGYSLVDIGNNRFSTYQALQLKAEKHTAKGLSFLLAYTYSRCIDDGSTLFGGLGGGNTAQYQGNLLAEKGLCNFNTNHRIALSAVYALPFGRGQRFLPDHGFLTSLASHWEISAIDTEETGQPFTVVRGIAQSHTYPTAGGDRPNIVANPMVAGPVAANPGCVAPSVVGVPQMWFNPCAFVAAPNAFGDEGRDALIGPRFDDLDFTLLKEVPLKSEARLLQLRLEVFNIFNHPNFDLPNNNFDSTTFGQLQTANAYGSRPPRQIQLGVKIIF
jgi:hypothetical protein